MLLFAPPVYPRDWSENGVSKTTRAKWDALIRALLTLDMLDGVMGREPRLVELSGDAKSSFKIWCREIGNMAFADHAIGSWLSKLAGTTARIALAVHLSRCIEGTEHDANRISQESMLAAIKIGRWWANELRRCLDPLLGDEMHVIEAGVLEWVRRRGGVVTIAELARSGPRRFRNKPDEAEAVLSKLARLGHGTLEIAQSSQKGGRPKSVFRLVDTGYVDTKLHKTAVLRGFVSISNVSKPETEGFTDNTPNPTPPESGGTDSGDSGRPQRPEKGCGNNSTSYRGGDVDLDELNRRAVRNGVETLLGR